MLLLLFAIILVVTVIVAVVGLLIAVGFVLTISFLVRSVLSSLGEMDDVVSRRYPSERMSPIKHTVSGYTCMQNGRKVNVRSYIRGSR